MVVTANLRHEDGSAASVVLPVFDSKIDDDDIKDALDHLGWWNPEPWTLISVERTEA